MLYKAFVKNNETGERKFIEDDYKSKTGFIEDLQRNGFSVSRVEPKDLYDFVMSETNGDKYDWEVAKRMYESKRPLTREEYSKAKDEYSEPIKQEDFDKQQKYLDKKLASFDETINKAKEKKDDFEDNPFFNNQEEMDNFIKELSDYKDKNPSGRDDIPVATRR